MGLKQQRSLGLWVKIPGLENPILEYITYFDPDPFHNSLQLGYYCMKLQTWGFHKNATCG
jgi:hypothetical protein